MRHYTTTVIMVFAFIVIGIGTVGGCGGGGGGGGCETALCQSPPLNTDFSDIGVFFVDEFNAVLIGITSLGDVVVIVLTDIPDSGAALLLGATATSSTTCSLVDGAADTDMDGDLTDEEVFPASGECFLVDDRSVFLLNDLVFGGLPFGIDLDGDCVDILQLESTAGLSTEAALSSVQESLSSALMRKAQELTQE